MALINCIECGHQISDQAQACPNCGHPVSSNPEFEKIDASGIKPEHTANLDGAREYGSHFGFSVKDTEDGREFSIRGVGIGPGRIMVLTILGGLIGVIIGLIGGAPGLGVFTALAGAVYAVLQALYRYQQQNFIITAGGFVRNGAFYPSSDITELLIYNKMAGGDIATATRSGGRFFIGGTGIAGVGLAVSSVLSNAASAFGADLRRMSDKSRVKREFQLCIRFGSKLIPLARFLNESKAVALFEAVAHEHEKLAQSTQAMPQAVGSKDYRDASASLTSLQKALLFLGYAALTAAAIGAAGQVILFVFKEWVYYFETAYLFIPFIWMVLALIVATALKEVGILFQALLGGSMVAWAIMNTGLVGAAAPIIFWGVLLFKVDGITLFDRSALMILISIRTTWTVVGLLGAGFLNTLGLGVGQEILPGMDIFACLYVLEAAALMAVMPMLFRLLSSRAIVFPSGK